MHTVLDTQQLISRNSEEPTYNILVLHLHHRSGKSSGLALSA